MIPKIIHFCWLSDNPFPHEIQKCMDTWRKVLPDYEFWKWDFKRFPKNQSEWVSEAFDSKKYAFAADYIRNYALCQYGGIYLDTDVEVLKSFNPLLHLPYFLGYENGSGCIEAAVMGSEPHHPIFERMMHYYESHPHFINEDSSMNMKPLPHIMKEELASYFKINPISNIHEFELSDELINVLPFDHFSPIHIENKRLEDSEYTYTIHRFAASWTTGWPRYRRKIKKIIGPDLTQQAIKMKRFLVKIMKGI